MMKDYLEIEDNILLEKCKQIEWLTNKINQLEIDVRILRDVIKEKDKIIDNQTRLLKLVQASLKTT